MRKTIAALLLIAYGLTLFYLTLVLHTTPRLPAEGRLNLVPGRTITIFQRKGGREMVVNNVGNLAAFLPLGMLLPIMYAGRMNAWRVGLAAGCVSLLIETLQFASGRRVADLDDLLLNTLGGLLGFLLFQMFRRVYQRARPLAPSP